MLCYSICNGLDNCNVLVMEESKCHFFTSTPAMVKDPNGKSLHPDTFKIINAQTHSLDNGQLFPFKSSTSLHPEWPVSALRGVSVDVAEAVQEALLALNDHAASLDYKQNLRCETTPALAELARDCKN